MPADSMYLPLQVGKALAAPLGYAGDDTGINISSKNPDYCELTGLYWAWKNVKAEYVGLAHYRRHFTVRNTPLVADKRSFVLSSDELSEILKSYDVVVPKRRNYFIETNRSHYVHAHQECWLRDIKKILHNRYPEYLSAFDHVMTSTSAHMFNMLVMKRTFLLRYCSWLFDVLEELEFVVTNSPVPAERRLYGFAGELLLNVWLTANHIRYAEVDYMFMEHQNWIKKIGLFLKRKYLPECCNSNYKIKIHEQA